MITLITSQVLLSVKTTIQLTSQDNYLVNYMNEVIYSMIFTKYLDNKLFGYINICGETLSYIAGKIRASYHCTLKSTPVQAVFGGYMIFNAA